LKNPCLLFALVMITFLTAPCIFAFPSVQAEVSENTWQEMTPMPTARNGIGLSCADEKIYCIGGMAQGAISLYVNEMYNPASNSWTTKQPMPTARYSFGIAENENRIYCIGGASRNTIHDTNEVYDAVSDTWETKASMPTARLGITANMVNGKIYVIGGDPDFGGPASTVNEVYDIATNTWISKTPIPARAAAYASVVVGDKIYIIGGVAGIDNPFLGIDASVKLVQVYDCSTDTWTSSSSLPAYSRGASAAVTSGTFAPQKIYLISVNPSLGTNTWVYSPGTNAWAQGAFMSPYLVSIGVAVVDDLVYVVGSNGTNGVTLRYTPFGFNGQYSESSAANPISTVAVVTGIAVAVTVIVAAGVTVYHFKHAPVKAAKPS
jgi:N-acetylneuraminic acid mutarotase